MPDRIDIALGFDAKYAPHAAAVITSVVRHLKDPEYRFIAIHTGVSETIRSKVERVAPKAQFVWAEVSDDDLPPLADRGHFNRSILFRIGLEKLAPPDCKRVLYLDSDTIVLHDVRELWNSDLGTCPIGAVADCYVDAEAFSKRWSLSGDTPRYFNSGVLLINLERVRAERSFSAASDFIARHGADILFADQDALNWAFWGRWRELDAAWNVQRFMTSAEMGNQRNGPGQSDSKGPQLVHFIGMEKPWMPGVWHPWAWLYWENLVRTPFAEDVARQFGMNFYQLMRLRLRWWIKRPYIRPRWLGV